jgi:hypothetical protein
MKGEIQTMNTNSTVLIVDETNVLSFMSASLSNIKGLSNTNINFSLDIFEKYCNGLQQAYAKFGTNPIGNGVTLRDLIPIDAPVGDFLGYKLRERYLITVIVLGHYLIQGSKSSQPAYIFEPSLSYTQGFRNKDVSAVPRVIKAFSHGEYKVLNALSFERFKDYYTYYENLLVSK